MAFRIAVSGLKGAATDLDVTGNNIANSNTIGFKGARAEFADVYAASNLGTVREGIGQGVKTAAISQQFAQGNISFTENDLDLAINGQGFFMLQEPDGNRVYSRAGAFGVDKDSFIVNSVGQRLVGFQANNGAVTKALGPIQLSRSNMSPRATTAVVVDVNLDAAASVPTTAFDPIDPSTYNYSTSTSVYDALGEEHLATIYFRKTASNVWDTHIQLDQQAPAAEPSLTFDANGRLDAATLAALPFSGTFDPGNGANLMDITFNFTASTQFGADSGVNSLQQDGYTTGRLSGLDIDEEGLVVARYTNGQFLAQGQVALANFSNPQGLQPLGDTGWAETHTSGVALMGAPGSASLGLLQSGALEESNVDLAEQLVNMIVAQRNFQANAQMIRAEDEITQTIINIR